MLTVFRMSSSAKLSGAGARRRAAPQRRKPESGLGRLGEDASARSEAHAVAPTEPTRPRKDAAALSRIKNMLTSELTGAAGGGSRAARAAASRFGVSADTTGLLGLGLGGAPLPSSQPNTLCGVGHPPQQHRSASRSSAASGGAGAASFSHPSASSALGLAPGPGGTSRLAAANSASVNAAAAAAQRQAELEARAHERERRLAAEQLQRAAARLARKQAKQRAEEEAAAREADAVRRERETALMAAEEERTRTLELAVAGITAARAEALGRVAEVLSRARRVAAMRAAHAPAATERLRSGAHKRGLKSDVKKGIGLVKRVTSVTEETAPQLVREVETHNLSRYASEVRSRRAQLRAGRCSGPGMCVVSRAGAPRMCRRRRFPIDHMIAWS